MSVSEYYNKMKWTWDELNALNKYPSYVYGRMEYCTCDVKEQIVDFKSQTKLIQLLMGLSDVYELCLITYMSLEPLPFVNRNFYLIQ